jgi:hypothetical protein
MAAADGLMVDSDKATSEKSRLKTKFKFSDLRAPGDEETQRIFKSADKSICSRGETNFILVWYGC